MKTKNRRKKLRKLFHKDLKRWMRETKTQPLTMLAASAYKGDRCQGCGVAFRSARDVMTDTVWWPGPLGRIGHRQCYRRAHA